MKRIIQTVIALTVLLLAIPFTSNTASAADFSDIEDGNHDINIKLLQKGTNKTSAAAGFMSDKATLSVKGKEVKLTFLIPENPMMEFSGFNIEGKSGVVNQTSEGEEHTFTLSELKQKLSSDVSYKVPAMDLVHNGVGMDIELLGLGDLPKNPEPAEDVRKTGTLLTEDEADSVYKVNFDSDSKATKGQLENSTKILEKDGKQYVQIGVNERGAPLFRSLQFNGTEVTWNSITEGPYTIQFALPNGVDSKLDVSMVIQAGPNAMPHDGINLWFDKNSLEVIKETEEKPEEKPEPAEDVRKTGTLLTEAEADAVYKVNFESDSPATNRQLENPTKIIEKDGKQYVQIGVNGAEYFRSLQFNGTEVTWNSITEGPYTIQFELPNGLEDEIDVSMVIQAGPNAMPHEGIKLWFDEDSLEVVKEKPEPKPDPTPTETEEPTPPPVEVEVGKTTPTPIKPNQTVKIGKTGSSIVVPADLPEGGSIVVKEVKDTEQKVKDKDKAKLEIAGDIYTVELVNIDTEHLDGTFTLTLNYDEEVKGDPAIYYYNETKNEWEIRRGGTIDEANYTISLEVKHFSTYGVFVTKADEKESTLEDSKEDPKEDPKENPEKKDPKKYNNLRSFKATILKDDKSDKSVANEFFLDGGFLYELQGKTYAELTIRNAEMVKDLKSEFGKAKTLKEFEEDGVLYRVVRLQVDENLKDTLLTMTIHVPGLYESTYDTYLKMSDVKEIKEEDKEKEQKENIEESKENKPSIIDEVNGNNGGNGNNVDNNHNNVDKPEFGNQDNGQGIAGKKIDGNNNPQTGDTTMIAFYTVLLIGSLLVLFFQYKRRFVN